jgi:ABC-2 type transport system ATP-binding protein
MIVSVSELTHRYGERTALDRISFAVPEGRIFALLGPNGGGKSTLFRILSTVMAPSAGRATVAGFDVSTQPSEVRRLIGVVFQSQSLDRKLTVGENLRAQGHFYGISGATLRDRIGEVTRRLHLADRVGDIVETLSGGLRRRVEIAKSLLHRPRVLLMDEPSTGLDPAARRELWQYIIDLRSIENVTVLLTTHILDEADRADELVLLHQGRIVAAGTPAELKARVGGDVVVLESPDTAALEAAITSRFGVRATVAGANLRVEIDNGHRFIAEVVEAFPGAIQSVALHKPTLEDVFLDETGATL